MSVLIAKYKWLLVQRFIVYHSLLLMWKMVRNDYPLNLLLIYTYWPGDCLSTETIRKLITKASGGQRSLTLWNNMPSSLRAEQNLKRFKKSLCQWMLDNVARDAGESKSNNGNNENN